MNHSKIVPLIFTVLFSACGTQSPKHNHVIEFGDVLMPHYKTSEATTKCENWQEISIPVFDQQDQTIAFRYSLCSSDADAQMIDFNFKSKFITLEDYVFGKYKFPTPEQAFTLNPDADKYTFLDIPIFGVTKLGQMSPREYLKNKKTIHKMDWSICEIKKVDEHIWQLENPLYKEVPVQNYTLDKYSSFNEWELNRDADKAIYKKKYGDQQLINRACANEQHNWYVAIDGILITVINPADFDRGIDPASIIYTDRD